MAEDAAPVRTNDAPLLPIKVGTIWLALPALQVVEIVDQAPPLFLPRAPAHVPGLLNLRGTALPLLSVATFLDLPESREGAGFPRVVVVAAAEMTVGLLCNAVLGVIPAGDCTTRPPSDPSGKLVGLAVAEIDVVGRIATVIDLAALLEQARVRG